jgi:hypothetical protein
LTKFRQTPPPPSEEELQAAVSLLSRPGTEDWVAVALERRLKAINEARRQANEDAGELEATPEPSFVKHYPTIPKPRKERLPWTEDEESFLVQLVAKRGARWSEFETLYSDNRLFNRDQTAIKDKARNIIRKIIDQGGADEFYERCPKWREVTVGSSRRGVHGYKPGQIPKRKKKAYIDMVEG